MQFRLPSTLLMYVPLLLVTQGRAQPGLTEMMLLNFNKAGKYQVPVSHRPSEYAILYRSENLVDWTPVDMVLGSQPDHLRVLSDTVRPRKRGFYDVRYVPIASLVDTDEDGRDDFEELADGTALNPASELPFASGALNLPDLETFDRLAKRDNFPGAQNVKEVKFLITDLTTNPELYFVNVNEHQFHYDFARNGLGRYTQHPYSTGNVVFNNETYFTSFRKNLAGSLVSHENYVSADGERGLYTVEFWPTDPVSFEFIQIAYEMIAANAPFIDRLVYHAPSETQRRVQGEHQKAFDRSFVHSIQTDELFSSVDYTPLNQQEAFGRLVLATGADALSARDIVIFRNLPNDLTHVAGIITEVPQTPLSHVNLKARQNDTPNAYIANASTHPDIQPFLGENVFYRVAPEGFEIRLATQEEVDDYFESIRPDSTSVLSPDLTIQEIRPLSEISFADTDAFGGKAANVAELQRIMPDVAPDGFAIPFYFYDEFMKANGLYAQAEYIMNDAVFQSNPAVRRYRLEQFQLLIKRDSSVPPWILAALTELQQSFPAGVTPRLRSSANAEDSVEFNGAGLYDSFTHQADEGHIVKSVLQVWASLWNYRAWEEREFYRIDHLSSAMGVLVHPNYRNEQANGVAVARNIFDPNWEGYYLNVQVGEDLVTNPEAESIPEEMLVARLATFEYEVQYIRSSNQLPAGEKVLTREQILDLVAKMRTLNNHFDNLYPGFDPDFAMEIEFKITEEGRLAIKQARPWVD